MTPGEGVRFLAIEGDCYTAGRLPRRREIAQEVTLPSRLPLDDLGGDFCMLLLQRVDNFWVLPAGCALFFCRVVLTFA
jgi:hypothetical protein